MEINNLKKITTRIVGTKYYTFNVPEVGERVILLHNSFNINDANAIMVINKELQQIGHLKKKEGFNIKIGKLIDWQPFTAKVVAVFYESSTIFIEIEKPQVN